MLKVFSLLSVHFFFVRESFGHSKTHGAPIIKCVGKSHSAVATGNVIILKERWRWSRRLSWKNEYVCVICQLLKWNYEECGAVVADDSISKGTECVQSAIGAFQQLVPQNSKCTRCGVLLELFQLIDTQCEPFSRAVPWYGQMGQPHVVLSCRGRHFGIS